MKTTHCTALVVFSKERRFNRHRDDIDKDKEFRFDNKFEFDAAYSLFILHSSPVHSSAVVRNEFHSAETLTTPMGIKEAKRRKVEAVRK